jgi:hypothetical protein
MAKANKVNLKPAHRALGLLVGNLRRFREERLDALKKPGRISQFDNGNGWVEFLEIAVREIETWCIPNSLTRERFTIDVPPAPNKPRVAKRAAKSAKKR